MSELQITGGIEDRSNFVFLFLIENVCCDPSLEPSQRDGSNDGSQHTFERSSMENYPKTIHITPSNLKRYH